MRKENQDVVGEKCVRDDAGNLSFSDEDKRKAWKQHYEKLLNVEFPWPEAELPHVAPVEGPPILITAEMVSDSIRKMKQSKAPGPSGIVAEMLKAAPDCCSQLIADLTNAVVFEGKIPSDWDDSFIINLYKGKGDALERGNYRGMKLTDQVLKVIERILEKCIRQIIDIDSMQFGLVAVLLMPSLLSVRFKRSISLRTRIYILLSLIWRKPLIEFLAESSGGPCVLLVFQNGL